MQRKIGAYIRVSTEEQAAAIEGSLDNQKYRLKAFVDLKNTQEKKWGEIVDFYIDDGFSAKDTRRPAFQRMIADIKKKKVDLILIADVSRLSRNIADFCGILEELEKQQAQFLSIKEQFDTSTPVGKMMIYNMINLAQFEREQISERVSLGVHARSMRGLLNGARPILGYDKVPDKPGSYVVNEDEAKNVIKIFRHFLNSGSRAKTIQELDQEGIKPKLAGKFGKLRVSLKWNSSTLGNILSSAAYIGKHEVNKANKGKPQHTLKPYKQYKMVEATWPAIVTEDDFWEAQTLLEEAQKLERVRLEGAEDRFYVLTGTLRCGECGGPLVGKTAHGEKSIHRYYQHTNASIGNGCKIQRVVAPAIEEAVIKYIWNATKDAGYLDKLETRLVENQNVRSLDKAKEKRALKLELSESQAKIENLLLMRVQSGVGSDSLKWMTETFEALSIEKAALVERLSRLEEQSDAREFVKESIEGVSKNLNDFKRGFVKAKGSLKKRLVRRLLKQVVLTSEGLLVFMYLADGSDIPNHQIKLIKELDQKTNETEAIYLARKASGDDSNLSVLRSPIGKNGDLSLQTSNVTEVP